MKEIEIINKLLSLTRRYNYIFFTVDMRGFIYNKSINNYDTFFTNLFINLNKNKKTSIIPAYTFTDKGRFDIYKTKPTLGLLTKWSFEKKNIIRSEHPLFSCIGLGENRSILRNIKKSAFGKRSIFDKLYENKSCMIHLGRPLEMGNTSIHYVEQMVGATYRFNKLFKTKVYDKNKYIGTDYTVFVRKLLNTEEKDSFVTNTAKFSKALKLKGLVKEYGDIKKNTNITFLDYKNSIDFMIDEFYKDKNIFINNI